MAAHSGAFLSGLCVQTTVMGTNAAPGISTERLFDAEGRLVQQRDGLGNTLAWNYRADGRLLSYKDLGGQPLPTP
jgi:YD repeat-containing protein